MSNNFHDISLSSETSQYYSIRYVLNIFWGFY